MRIVRVQDDGVRRLGDLGLGGHNGVLALEPLEVHGADGGDHRNGGRAPAAELGDLTLAVGAHLGHEDVSPGGELFVDGPGQPDPVEGDRRQVDVDYLAPGVHAGIGATGAGDHRGLAHAGRAPQCVAQHAGHGRDLGLRGETSERRPVVGEQQPPALKISAGGLGHS